MKILYMGGGFVGACSAAVSADSGHEVLVYDINEDRVQKLSSLDKDIIESSLYEEGLGELIIRHEKRLKFSSRFEDLEEFIEAAEAVFMCLPTPEKDSTGETNLEYYERACRDLGSALIKRNGGTQSNYILVINKSTVPVDMVNRTKDILEECGVANFGVGSNPEFLVEGKAIEGSIRPSRIVVGAWSERDFVVFRDIYKRFCDSPNVTYIEVNPLEAAAGKLLANYTLFNRLAVCYDVVGRTCETFSDLHFENIRKILISDKRIGEWGFYDSLYAGGSCFIKDARSLAHQLKEKDVTVDLVEEVLEANVRQLVNFMERPKRELGFDWTGKKVGMLGTAFKRDTNDIRNSGALGATEYLLENGVESIKAFDPVANPNYLSYFSAHPEFNKLKSVDSEEEVIRDVDVLIVATDWPQFRELTDTIKELLPKGALIMDGRRMLHNDYAELKDAGFTVVAVGVAIIK